MSNTHVLKEFNFPLLHKLSNDEYKEVYENGVLMSVSSPERDESFWGILFSEEDVDIHKKEKGRIRFIAANTTLCGCICGTVYEAICSRNYRPVMIDPWTTFHRLKREKEQKEHTNE